jgi:hypothetical protein
VPLDPVKDLQQAIGHGGEQAFTLVPMILVRVLRDELWRERTRQDGKPFASFEEFAAHKLWWGLETPVEDLRVFCRRRPEVVQAIDRALTPTLENGTNQHSEGFDSVKPSPTQGGNSAIYRRKRLKREREDLYEQVISGEMTLIAAEEQAGIRRPPTGLDTLRKAWRKASADERRVFLDEIGRHP